MKYIFFFLCILDCEKSRDLIKWHNLNQNSSDILWEIMIAFTGNLY